MQFDSHISQSFNDDLEEIRSKLLEMGGIVQSQLERALEALQTGDSELGAEVADQDKFVNRLEIEIDDLCAKIIVKRQPAAGDLRMVLAVSRITCDLERIGDEVAKIGGMAVKIAQEGPSPIGQVEIRSIAKQVAKMLADSLDAFARYDVVVATKTILNDENVDEEYGAVMRSLSTYMMEDPRSIQRVLNMMWALRSLERIGDHATNVCEQVIYLVDGKEQRHQED